MGGKRGQAKDSSGLRRARKMKLGGPPTAVEGEGEEPESRSSAGCVCARDKAMGKGSPAYSSARWRNARRRRRVYRENSGTCTRGVEATCENVGVASGAYDYHSLRAFTVVP